MNTSQGKGRESNFILLVYLVSFPDWFDQYLILLHGRVMRGPGSYKLENMRIKEGGFKDAMQACWEMSQL